MYIVALPQISKFYSGPSKYIRTGIQSLSFKELYTLALGGIEIFNLQLFNTSSEVAIWC